MARKPKHKNSNDAKGNFAIYSIDIQELLYKIGKADDDRRTKSTNLPTRLHQQVRQLRKKHGKENVNYGILKKLFGVTTKDAKTDEEEILQVIYNATGEVPKGNRRSFKPKRRK